MNWSADHERTRLGLGCAPDWADHWGEDRYGVFAAFVIDGVAQRMRWIRPGTFMMGSPVEEVDRVANELLHEVTLTAGFWMADTPCTQALWQVVMGYNPSQLKSPRRPVEMVTWEDVRKFLLELNARRPGLCARLPTEAQWEYACRAGESAASYAGPMELLGARNAPILDEIAWYSGNSGNAFELANGFDSSDWPDKQYPHARAGTRDVGLKRPNEWGLHDMLGNVWEWCADWYCEYAAESIEDQRGPRRGHFRVARGGSWYCRARRVRAAFRLLREPGRRSVELGFRLIRSHPLPPNVLGRRKPQSITLSIPTPSSHNPPRSPT